MAHSLDGIATDVAALGVRHGDTLMVHASLSALGRVEGGAATVVEALIATVGADDPAGGTLVMAGFRDSLSVPGRHRSLPDCLHEEARRICPWLPLTETPTSMGAIPEAFRQRPGTRRSPHPCTAYLALGAGAEALCAAHPLPFATGPSSPAGRLYEGETHQLLLGVGFNRLSQLHHAETRLPHGRRKTRIVALENRTLLAEDAGDDRDVHFPEIGRRFLAAGLGQTGKIGDAEAILMATREIDDFAYAYLADALHSL
ncbi:MAG: AAC(3) family N-acetyltransferase [Pseudomonadota bacterium]